MVPSLGPTTSFYWASKLLRGTFWAGLKTLKTSAAAFEGLRTAPQAVSIGLRNCHVARFGQALKPSKPPQQLSKALKTLKTCAAAFEGFRTSQPYDEQTRKSLISIHSIHCPTIYVYTT